MKKAKKRHYQKSDIHPAEYTERICKMQTYLEKTRERFEHDLERSKNISIKGNDGLAALERTATLRRRN